MKKYTKALCCFFAFFTLLLPLTFVREATMVQAAQVDTTLKFTNGKFKILVIADIQDSKNVNKDTLNLITLALKQETPDLVVFLGDNVYGVSPQTYLSTKNVKNSIAQFLQPVINNGVPFAVVFGNHDAECTTSKAEQMAYYMTFPGCLAVPGTIGDRVGNYNLAVQGENGKDVLNLWFLDSGEKIKTVEYGKGYAYVTDKQISWYQERSAEVSLKNSGQVPAVLFQHIAVPEMYDLLLEVPRNTPGAVEGHGRWSNKYYIANEELVSDGNLLEGPCPPDYNNGQFQSWVNTGDIMAAVFGHDHKNDLVGTLQDVDLIYTSGAGYYHYGSGNDRGVRVMEFYEDDLHAYSSKMLYYSELNNGVTPKNVPDLGMLLYDPSWWLTFGALLVVLVTIVAVPTVCIRKNRKKSKAAKDALHL